MKKPDVIGCRASIPTGVRNARSKTAAASSSKKFRTLNDVRQSQVRKRSFLISISEDCTRGLLRHKQARSSLRGDRADYPSSYQPWPKRKLVGDRRGLHGRETNLFGCVRCRNGDHAECSEDPINRCGRGNLDARNATPSAYRSTVISGCPKPTYRIE